MSRYVQWTGAVWLALAGVWPIFTTEPDHSHLDAYTLSVDLSIHAVGIAWCVALARRAYWERKAAEAREAQAQIVERTVTLIRADGTPLTEQVVTHTEPVTFRHAHVCRKLTATSDELQVVLNDNPDGPLNPDDWNVLSSYDRLGSGVVVDGRSHAIYQERT